MAMKRSFLPMIQSRLSNWPLMVAALSLAGRAAAVKDIPGVITSAEQALRDTDVDVRIAALKVLLECSSLGSFSPPPVS